MCRRQLTVTCGPVASAVGDQLTVVGQIRHREAMKRPNNCQIYALSHLLLMTLQYFDAADQQQKRHPVYTKSSSNVSQKFIFRWW